MIQLVFSQPQNSTTETLSGDEQAYRSWLSRRDMARQQIRRLSRRELQVVSLVSQGHANKSIATELEISVKTIEKHRANAARKLGVNSTAEMVRLNVLADYDAPVAAQAPVAAPTANPMTSAAMSTHAPVRETSTMSMRIPGHVTSYGH